MAATQSRHLKLWFAGQAKNWPLASYELDELEEGFADVLAYHPTHKGAPRPLKELLPTFTTTQLQALRAAVAAKSPPDFIAAYDVLTQSCSACHASVGYGFIKVCRPRSNPHADQDFTPQDDKPAPPQGEGH